MGGYPLILGRPWLATTNAYIACQSRKMTISSGFHTKNLTLYSPTQPLLLDDQVVWPNLGYDDLEAKSIHQLMMIGRESFIDDQEEDKIISSIILNEYGTQSPMCPQDECILKTIVPPLNSLNHLEAL